MAFIEVDPSSIKLDSAPASSGGFVEVDPASIKLDAPQGAQATESPFAALGDRTASVVEGIGRAGTGIMQLGAELFRPIDNQTAFGKAANQGADRFNNFSREMVDESRARDVAKGTELYGMGGEVLGSLPFVAGGKGTAVNAAGNMLTKSAAAMGLGGAAGATAGLGQNDSRSANAALGMVTAGIVDGGARGAGAAIQGAKGAVSTLSKAGVTPDDIIKPEVLNKTYKRASNAAKQIGAYVKPEAAQPMMTKVGEVVADLRPDDAPKAFQIMGELNNIAKGPIDINAVDGLLKRINLHISGGTTIGGMTPDAAVLTQIKGAVKQFMNELDPATAITKGTPEAIQTFQTARGLWQQKIKLDDIGHMFKMATNQADNKVDPQLLRNEAGKLWRSETAGRYSAFSNEELGMLHEVYRSGKLGSAAEWLYNRLPTHVKALTPNLGVRDVLTKGRAGKLVRSVGAKAEISALDGALAAGRAESIANDGLSSLGAEWKQIRMKMGLSQIARIEKVMQARGPEAAAKVIDNLAAKAPAADKPALQELANKVRVTIQDSGNPALKPPFEAPKGSMADNFAKQVKKRKMSRTQAEALSEALAMKAKYGFVPDHFGKALRRLGGLNPYEMSQDAISTIRSGWNGQEVLRRTGKEYKEIGLKGLIRKKGGISPDGLLRYAKETKYLPEEAGFNELQALLKRVAGGEKVYSFDSMPERLREQLRQDLGDAALEKHYDGMKPADYDREYFADGSPVPNADEIASMFPSGADNIDDAAAYIPDTLADDLADAEAAYAKMQNKSLRQQFTDTAKQAGEQPAPITRKPSKPISLNARPEATVAALGLTSGAVGLGNFAASLAVPNEGPIHDRRLPRDKAMAMGLADRMDMQEETDRVEPASGPVRTPAAQPIAKPVAQEPDALQSYIDKMFNVESGGRHDAQAKTSSALGIGQYINSTWLASVDKYKPKWAEGLNKRDILLARKDPKKVREIATKDTQGYAIHLEKLGVPVTDTTLYLSHFLGPTGAKMLLTAKIGTPVQQVVTPEAYKANQSVFKGKKAEDILRWAMKKMGDA